MTLEIPTDFITNLVATGSAHPLMSNLALSSFDPKMLIGLTGVGPVESTIQYLKEQWALPGKLSPLVALLVGVGFNLFTALALGNDVVSAIYVGLATGFFSSAWHEYRQK